jgi:hypothetical protein
VNPWTAWTGACYLTGRMPQKRTLWGLPLLAAALVVANACSDQGEGERCSKDNDNTDCAAGLVCTQAANLSGSAPIGSALCCPPIGVPPTVDACQPKIGVGLDGGGNQPLPEAGSGPHADASKPRLDGGDAQPDAP